jgi:peroxiredoxin
MPKIPTGTVLPPTVLQTFRGETITIPSGGTELLHLQFRRFAGCPICNTHLRGFIKRAEDIKSAGVREIVFFHSSAKELVKHQTGLPFASVPDPGKTHYRAFGVETSLAGAMHPKALWAVLQSLVRGKMGLNMEHGPFGLPADFLISPAGKVLAVKYGTHAYDQWEVDELLAIAARAKVLA